MRGPNLLANTAASALQAHAAHRHFLQRDHRLAAHRGPLARLARTLVFDVTVKYGRRRTAVGDVVDANDGRVRPERPVRWSFPSVPCTRCGDVAPCLWDATRVAVDIDVDHPVVLAVVVGVHVCRPEGGRDPSIAMAWRCVPCRIDWREISGSSPPSRCPPVVPRLRRRDRL